GSRAFLAAVRGRRIDAVGRRGKFFVLELDGGPVLIGHLRMTGRLLVRPAAQPDPPFTRVRLALDDGRALLFTDVRKFGRLCVAPDVETRLGHLGPEPLGPGLTARWLARALAARRRA